MASPLTSDPAGPPRQRAPGWDELFTQQRNAFDSLVPFLGVAHLLAAEAGTVVEVGCGRGGQVDLAPRHGARPPQDLRGPGRTVIGIDVDAAGAQNPIVDEFRLIDGSGRWPLPDASADLAVSDYVLEHVADPAGFVAELTRVLRPGASFVARTVSRYSPLSLAARAVPNRHHPSVLRRLQPGRQARDVFPTEYRMNTERAIGELFGADYEWSVRHLGGLHHYFGPWPRLARATMAVEPRLPRQLAMTLLVYARKRS